MHSNKIKYKSNLSRSIDSKSKLFDYKTASPRKNRWDKKHCVNRVVQGHGIVVSEHRINNNESSMDLSSQNLQPYQKSGI